MLVNSREINGESELEAPSSVTNKWIYFQISSSTSILVVSYAPSEDGPMGPKHVKDSKS
jgi:hypothetical protein